MAALCVLEMAKHWKEEYTPDRASACGIYTYEGASVIRWGEDSDWIYFVEVSDFRFAFFSIEMLDLYIDFFSRKILPPREHTPFSDGPAASVGDGQSTFERLPARLRKKNVRPKVLRALTRAREEFERNT